LRRAGRDHDRREREGVRRHLLDRRVAAKPAATDLAAAADHARLRLRDRARAAAQPRQLPGFPLPARLLLRAPVWRAPGGLVDRRPPLLSRRHLRRPCATARFLARLAGGLLPLPVAVSGWSFLVDGAGGAYQSRQRQLHGLASRLRRLVPSLRTGGTAVPAFGPDSRSSRSLIRPDRTPPSENAAPPAAAS